MPRRQSLLIHVNRPDVTRLHPAIHQRITTFIPQGHRDIPQPTVGREQALRKLLHTLLALDAGIEGKNADFQGHRL